jgi:hypothetical protein
MMYPLLNARVWLGAAAAVVVVWFLAIILFGLPDLTARPEGELLASAASLTAR